jgi:hypothetical protein
MVEISKAHADLIDDGIWRAEDTVADVVLAQVILDMSHRIQFRAVRRQPQQVHRRRNLQAGGGVPSRPIQDHEAGFFAEAGLVLKQQSQTGAGGRLSQDRFEDLGESF